MAFKTKTQLVTLVERAIYQSAGSQVQIYSQDIIADMVQRAFDHVFIRRYWSYFVKRETRALDGTTGQITTPLTHITSFEDIHYVFRENAQRPLPLLPHNFNTLSMAGSTARFIAPSGDANLFTVYPVTSTGNVLIVGRRRPAEYEMDDEVEFDPTFITHYAAWDYFVDDGSNPASASKHQMLFESRLKQLESADQQHAVILDPLSSEIPTEWYYT